MKALSIPMDLPTDAVKTVTVKTVTVKTVTVNTDAAFVEALAVTRPVLRGLAARMMGSEAEADDVMQEAWLRAWRSRDSLQERGALQGWLRRIVVRECLRAMRWRGLRRLLSWEDRPEPAAPLLPADHAMIRAERSVQLQSAIAQLPAKQRLCFGLRFDEGWTVPEIAAACGMSAETVKTHLSRGVATVQKRMEEG